MSLKQIATFCIHCDSCNDRAAVEPTADSAIFWAIQEGYRQVGERWLCATCQGKPAELAGVVVIEPEPEKGA